METLVLAVHVLASVGVIGLVLLQHGKGADMGAAFGSGASGSLFGVSGSSNFLSRTTAILVAIFFVTSLTLAYLSSNRGEASSVVKGSVQTAPATSAQEEAKPAETTAEDVPQ
jgi:preprotein translocase subunit SecG